MNKLLTLCKHACFILDELISCSHWSDSKEDTDYIAIFISLFSGFQWDKRNI